MEERLLSLAVNATAVGCVAILLHGVLLYV